MPGSQTLDRGLRALELLAAAPEPMSITELAEALGVHRSNAYRILRTLEEHRFAVRDDAGMIRIGPRLAAVARGTARELRAAAAGELSEMANELGTTSFIATLDADEVITLISVEPRRGHAAVAQRPGASHHVSQGAPGHAIEASLTQEEHRAVFGGAPRSEAAERVTQFGYALSHDEVIPGLTSVAVPLRVIGEPPAALSIVRIGLPDDLAAVTARLRRAADSIARNFG